MRKRKPIDPNALRAGDYLYLTVPANRHLAAGVYKAKIETLAPKDPRWGRQFAHCSINCDDLGPFDFVIHFNLSIYDHPKLRGQCFLGGDEFPVGVVRELNLELRLQDSMPPCGKDKASGDN